MTDSLSSYLSARASMNEFRDKLIAEYHEHQAAAKGSHHAGCGNFMQRLEQLSQGRPLAASGFLRFQ